MHHGPTLTHIRQRHLGQGRPRVDPDPCRYPHPRGVYLFHTGDYRGQAFMCLSGATQEQVIHKRNTQSMADGGSLPDSGNGKRPSQDIENPIIHVINPEVDPPAPCLYHQKRQLFGKGRGREIGIPRPCCLTARSSSPVVPSTWTVTTSWPRSITPAPRRWEPVASRPLRRRPPSARHRSRRRHPRSRSSTVTKAPAWRRCPSGKRAYLRRGRGVRYRWDGAPGAGRGAQRGGARSMLWR